MKIELSPRNYLLKGIEIDEERMIASLQVGVGEEDPGMDLDIRLSIRGKKYERLPGGWTKPFLVEQYTLYVSRYLYTMYENVFPLHTDYDNISAKEVYLECKEDEEPS